MNQEKQSKVKEISGPLVAEQAVEERPIGRYQVQFVNAKMLDVPSNYTPTGREIVWSFSFEYQDQPGNLHSELVNRKNGVGGHAYKLGCGMSESGSVPEEVREDINKFGMYFMEQVGNYFEITLVKNKKGTRNIIGSIRPIKETEIKKDLVRNTESRDFDDDDLNL